MALRALEKPFLAFEWIFRFKRYINLNLSRGELYILNIRLKDSVFVQEIVRYMQQLDVEALLFEHRLTMNEFTRFVDRFVKRVDQSDHRNLLTSVLRENKVDTIEVNSEHVFAMFENNKQYRGDVQADFSVKSFVMQRLGDGPSLLAQIDATGQEALDQHDIDFDVDIIRYLLPEKIASLDGDIIRTHLSALASKIAGEQDADRKQSLVQSYQAAYRLTDYRHDRNKIVDALDESLEQLDASSKLVPQMTTPSSAIRLEVGGKLDQLVQQFLQGAEEQPNLKEYTDGFSRLLKTGQQGKAIQVISELMDLLEAPEPMRRQIALALLEGAVQSFNLMSDTAVCDVVIGRVIDRLKTKTETYEYSEVIWTLIEKSLSSDRFDLVARLTAAMAGRRRFVDSVTIYDSMAVKHAFSNINRSEVINALIDEMVKTDHETAASIREILVAIGTEEVALALADIISHPVRQIRQQTLKVLAELGKASLKVSSTIMADDAKFERDTGRHELPDARWYVIRNTVFVLGSLRDPEGVPALRLRINDKDIRVRREIVAALEKIGGDDACDLLIVMADDNDREIGESAVIAAGIIGTPEAAPLFIDVARRHPSLSARCVYALGRLGGDEARDYLIKLLGCEDELIRLVGEGVSKDDLRLAAIKALGNIGDIEAIDSIRDYNDNMSRTQKLFLKNSAVNKAISELLDRR